MSLRNPLAIYKNSSSLTTFSKSTSEFKQTMHEFIIEFKKLLPKDWSEKQKNTYLNTTKEDCRKNEKILEKLFNENANSDEFLEKALQYFEDQAKKSDEIKSESSKKVGSPVTWGSYLRTGVVALALLPTVYAQNGFVPHSGQPNGGMNLCNGYLTGCAQGYLAYGMMDWQAGLPQYQRLVSQVSVDGSVVTYKTLRDCMTIDKVGNMVAADYGNGNSSDATLCVLDSPIWQGWQVTGQATNMPEDKCSKLKNDFSVAASACQTWTGQAKNLGKIIGWSIGGTALLGCVCFCAYAAYHKAKNRDCSLSLPPCPCSP